MLLLTFIVYCNVNRADTRSLYIHNINIYLNVIICSHDGYCIIYHIRKTLLEVRETGILIKRKFNSDRKKISFEWRIYFFWI